MRFRKPIVIGVFGIVALMAMGFLFSRRNVGEEARAAPSSSVRAMSIDGTLINVTIADSFEERAQGLSGRPGLAANEGLFFIFPEDGQHSFWMKDMLFSIDIIWISKDGEVVHVEKNVSPESYPHPFTPDSPARYVLEVAAGFAEQHGIGIGSKASLP